MWHTIFVVCDDDEGKKVKLVRLPAHTAAWQVGKARKGDGAKISLLDREGNDIADGQAKKGAKTHRVAAWVCKKAETADRVALRAAAQLGITTPAANEHTEVTVQPDGTETKRIYCDSDGNPKAGTLKKSRRNKEKAHELRSRTEAKRGQAEPKTEGSHTAESCAAVGEAATGKLRKTSSARHSSAKTLRAFISDDASRTRRTKPRVQFLVREGPTFPEAATPARFAFQTAGSSRGVGDCPVILAREPRLLDSIACASEELRLRYRPLRETRDTHSWGSAKRTTESILKLLQRGVPLDAE